jgi:hypothetical protein
MPVHVCCCMMLPYAEVSCVVDVLSFATTAEECASLVGIRGRDADYPRSTPDTRAPERSARDLSEHAGARGARPGKPRPSRESGSPAEVASQHRLPRGAPGTRTLCHCSCFYCFFYCEATAARLRRDWHCFHCFCFAAACRAHRGSVWPTRLRPRRRRRRRPAAGERPCRYTAERSEDSLRRSSVRNWNDTEKISMAPAQGRHAQIEK